MDSDKKEGKKKRIAIMQPGYLPWLGFFELMHNCDIFVFLDDVQYTKRDWRNRNRIRTPEGWQWLTVPVLHKHRHTQLLKDVTINNDLNWKKQHLNALRFNYQKAEFFDLYFTDLRTVYSGDLKNLCELNISLIEFLRKRLGINTPQLRSSQLNIKTAKSQRVLDICKALGAKELYDSKGAAAFLETEMFKNEGITVEFQEYIHPVYPQVVSPFISHLCTLDLLFNCGDKSLEILLGKSIF